jgi:excisionase family DNA binding protein
MNEQLLTIKQASAILQVHPRTILRWARAGKITLVYLPVSHWPRITQAEIDRIMTPDKLDKSNG